MNYVHKIDNILIVDQTIGLGMLHVPYTSIYQDIVTITWV